MRYETQEPRTVLAALQSDEAGHSRAASARRLPAPGPHELRAQTIPYPHAPHFPPLPAPMPPPQP